MTTILHKKTSQTFGAGTLVLAFLSLLGLILVVYRWIVGLGVTTGLSDGRGWGLWISFDVLFGIAIASGAFCIAGVVYILRLKEFYPILRPTVLTGFLGYALAAFAISFDLGFPQRIYYMIFNWNIHSPLFEVGWCVMIYATVLALEISPIVFERFNMKAPMRIIRAITIPLVILGIVLSTMHQSSLGTLFLLMPHRVHPLWYSPIMPVLFFVSAIGAGLAMVIVESTWSYFGLKHKLEVKLLGKIARAIPIVLGIFLVLRMVDLFISGDGVFLFSEGYLSVLFWFETLIFTILPIILFSIPSVRRKPMQMFSVALLVIAGLLINRFNISLVAFSAGAYAPTWQELFVSIGMVAIGALVFTLASRYLAVFPHHSEENVTMQNSTDSYAVGELNPAMVAQSPTKTQQIEGKHTKESYISSLE
ncbi:MAG: Ni/Fe-hydrogenase cytochrome b subunit [Chloroflexi bacterium HGW-Chloroflexi-10]|nr:MAG: Ni/Fe-hydrogenase cytochrome b subunit [Chloroflexi bacterium HGW-Chloroflexi-10]